QYRQIDMMEHMYEANQTTVISDDSDEVNMNITGTVNAPFMNWLPEPHSQKLLLPKELIWIRKIQARMLMGGQFVWWEASPQGKFDFDYTDGKYAFFHERSQEEHQHAWDYIQQDKDIFGAKSVLTIEGIKYRWRRNNNP